MINSFCVVNCFQNCIFTYDSQLQPMLVDQTYSCELLSKLYFYLWFPTQRTNTINQFMLWIAFKIVFLLMIPNNLNRMLSTNSVVNCFQNCIFTYDSQPTHSRYELLNCCELLSKLYFYLWFPTSLRLRRRFPLLWIAFKIVFLLMIPNGKIEFSSAYTLWIAFKIVFLLMIPNRQHSQVYLLCVVNCFQNCIFTYDSQHKYL